MKIEFEENDGSNGGWSWHYGTLIKDGKEYPFSILEMKTNVGGMDLPPEFEITWVEDEPTEKETSEKSVLEHFRMKNIF